MGRVKMNAIPKQCSYPFVDSINTMSSSSVPFVAEYGGCTIIPPAVGHIIWVGSQNCGRLVTWFCNQLIAKPGNKTASVPWPDPYLVAMSACLESRQRNLIEAALVEIMICCPLGTKPISKPMLGYFRSDLRNILQLNFHQNLNFFIQENAFECICQNGGHFVQGKMC